jgi:hypothetical protein
MAPRLRRCIECPRCGTRYLIGFSPYGNGAYLISFITESSEEYRLFCPCVGLTLPSQWDWSELKTYAISNAAYAKGYGGPGEILPCR